MPTWKEKLADKTDHQLAEEIDVFETQMALRRQGKLDEKIFAETRLRRGCYGQRYDNGHRHDGIRTQQLPYLSDVTKGPKPFGTRPACSASKSNSEVSPRINWILRRTWRRITPTVLFTS